MRLEYVTSEKGTWSDVVNAVATYGTRKKAEQPQSHFHYIVQPDSLPDVSIVPLGNATGRIMAFELIVAYKLFSTYTRICKVPALSPAKQNLFSITLLLPAKQSQNYAPINPLG